MGPVGYQSAVYFCCSLRKKPQTAPADFGQATKNECAGNYFIKSMCRHCSVPYLIAVLSEQICHQAWLIILLFRQEVLYQHMQQYDKTEAGLTLKHQLCSNGCSWNRAVSKVCRQSCTDTQQLLHGLNQGQEVAHGLDIII